MDIPDDGSMSKDHREASLEKIRSSKTVRVILISFKAGSTGERANVPAPCAS